MNLPGISSAEETSSAARSEPEALLFPPAAGESRARKPYVAPAIVEFGSVTEFTRGSGSATLQDARRTSRQRARG